MLTRKQSNLSRGKRKTVCALLAFATLAGLIAGCSKETTAPSTNDHGNGTQQTSSFSYWSILDANASSSVTQLGEVEFYKALEKNRNQN